MSEGNEQLLKLAERIRDEFIDLDRLAERVQAGWHQAQSSGDDLYLDRDVSEILGESILSSQSAAEAYRKVRLYGPTHILRYTLHSVSCTQNAGLQFLPKILDAPSG